MKWYAEKRERDDRDLKEVEEALQHIYKSKGEGYNSLESKEALLNLEKLKTTFRRTRGGMEEKKSSNLVKKWRQQYQIFSGLCKWKEH
jgi:hypothetical protein